MIGQFSTLHYLLYYFLYLQVKFKIHSCGTFCHMYTCSYVNRNCRYFVIIFAWLEIVITCKKLLVLLFFRLPTQYRWGVHVQVSQERLSFALSGCRTYASHIFSPERESWWITQYHHELYQCYIDPEHRNCMALLKLVEVYEPTMTVNAGITASTTVSCKPTLILSAYSTAV